MTQKQPLSHIQREAARNENSIRLIDAAKDGDLDAVISALDTDVSAGAIVSALFHVRMGSQNPELETLLEQENEKRAASLAYVF